MYAGLSSPTSTSQRQAPKSPTNSSVHACHTHSCRRPTWPGPWSRQPTHDAVVEFLCEARRCAGDHIGDPAKLPPVRFPPHVYRAADEPKLEHQVLRAHTCGGKPPRPGPSQSTVTLTPPPAMGTVPRSRQSPRKSWVAVAPASSGCCDSCPRAAPRWI